VRVQRLLRSDDVPNDSGDMETWTLAHVTSKHVNPETKEKLLRLRYADG
jgi:hypothetical protein